MLSPPLLRVGAVGHTSPAGVCQGQRPLSLRARRRRPPRTRVAEPYATDYGRPADRRPAAGWPGQSPRPRRRERQQLRRRRRWTPQPPPALGSDGVAAARPPARPTANALRVGARCLGDGARHPAGRIPPPVATAAAVRVPRRPLERTVPPPSKRPSERQIDQPDPKRAHRATRVALPTRTGAVVTSGRRCPCAPPAPSAPLGVAALQCAARAPPPRLHQGPPVGWLPRVCPPAVSVPLSTARRRALLPLSPSRGAGELGGGRGPGEAVADSVPTRTPPQDRAAPPVAATGVGLACRKGAEGGGAGGWRPPPRLCETSLGGARAKGRHWTRRWPP